MAVLGAATLFSAPDAAADDGSVIQIAAVLASKDRRSFDPRLKFIRADLRALPYRSYTLLDLNFCRFRTGDQCAMDIPGGGYLQARTTETTPTHLKMKLLLIQNNRPLLDAAVKLNRNAGILLRLKSTDTGTILLSIKAPNASSSIDDVEKAMQSTDQTARK